MNRCRSDALKSKRAVADKCLRKSARSVDAFAAHSRSPRRLTTRARFVFAPCVVVHALIMLGEHSLVQPLSTGGGRRSVAAGARRLRSGDRRAHRHAVQWPSFRLELVGPTACLPLEYPQSTPRVLTILSARTGRPHCLPSPARSIVAHVFLTQGVCCAERQRCVSV